MKDLTYFSIMYGGVPMTPQGAQRFLIQAQLAGHSFKECLQFIPDDFLSKSGKRNKYEVMNDE